MGGIYRKKSAMSAGRERARIEWFPDVKTEIKKIEIKHLLGKN